MDSTAYQHRPSTINSNVGNVIDSYKNVWNNCEILVSDEKHQVLAWLSPMAPWERHQSVREGRVDGIGSWLLRTNQFEKWHTSEDQGVNPVLFCYGDPGVGKTYLSSLVIDTLCDALDRDNVAVACVYCDFHTHKEKSVTHVLAALLRQLVAGMEPIPQEITEAYQRAKREVGGRALRLLDIHSILVKSVALLRRGFICIDGLDELPEKTRTELCDSLRYIVQECPNIRLFITGRPHIREEVNESFPRHPDLISITPTKEDIQVYLTMRLQKDSLPDAMNTELSTDILRIIPEQISGVFLHASLIMNRLMQGTTVHQREKTLHKMANGFGLHEAYSTTWNRIKKQSEDKVKLGMEALMWISCSERPLTAEELRYALAAEVGTSDFNVNNLPSMRTLLNCTLGLVKIDEQASIFRLVHFTLQEYLSAHPSLFITPHSKMAEICLTYLNFPSICKLSTTFDAIRPTKPLLHYASCYWGLHARKKMGGNVKRLAIGLLRRDANHISANILLSEESIDFLPRWDRYCGKHPDLRGFTGLHCISYMGVAEIARAMLGEKIWDLNGRDSNGATPLIWAAKYGNPTLAKLLLAQRGIDSTLSDHLGLTALTHAAKAGHQDIVKLLLEHESFNHNSSDRSSRTALLLAAEFGAEGVVKLLLERGDVNPNSLDKSGQTPLSFAANSRHEGLVRLLLKRDANPNSPDRTGRTPLSFSAESGHEGVVKLLLEQRDVNPDSSDKHGQTPLSFAAESGHKGVVKLLLEQRDVNPDSSDKYGQTPLSFAAESGHECVVKLLLEREDINPNSPDWNGRTPLSFAAGSGNENVVKLLLKREDVSPHWWNKHGWKPLAFAAESGHEGVVELLRERGRVNPDWWDNYQRTPLPSAAESRLEGIVEMLQEPEDATSGSGDDWDDSEPSGDRYHMLPNLDRREWGW